MAEDVLTQEALAEIALGALDRQLAVEEGWRERLVSAGFSTQQAAALVLIIKESHVLQSQDKL